MEVQDWCNKNKMVINPTKTKSMLIGSRQKLQQIHNCLDVCIDDKQIQQETEHKLLGVTIDHNLAWHSHVEVTCKTLARKLFLLSRLKGIVNTHAKLLFFNAHIKPHFDYVSNIWDCCSERLFARLNSLYRLSLIHI